jgi:mannose-6-phosphate isomerase-like protein (cupin superfamily)
MLAGFRARVVSMPEGYGVDLLGISATDPGTGVLWTLEGSTQVNANLVRFDAGGGVGEHVNEEVDVLFVGVAGSGIVRVDGEEHVLSAGRLVFAPRGARTAPRRHRAFDPGHPFGGV